jgi:HSP20 family protein
MTFLARRENLFDDLFDFRRDFDGMFNRILKNGTRTEGGSTAMVILAPPIEAWVDTKEKKYHLRVALPGVTPDEVKLDLQGNSLAISGEHKTGGEKKESNHFHKEFSFESFERTVLLPEDVDAEKITAEYKNGVLEIVAPLSAAAIPKRIEIKTEEKAEGTSA